MNNNSDAGRRAIRRRNENLRQLGQGLTMVGSAAVVALVVVLLNGVDLPWTALAGLAATAVVSIGLSFYVLRFRDYSV